MLACISPAFLSPMLGDQTGQWAVSCSDMSYVVQATEEPGCLLFFLFLVASFLNYFFNIYLFIGCVGLSCSMQDLLLQHVGFSLVEMQGLSSCGMQA